VYGTNPPPYTYTHSSSGSEENKLLFLMLLQKTVVLLQANQQLDLSKHVKETCVCILTYFYLENTYLNYKNYKQ
jgi:hypothetical protein